MFLAAVAFCGAKYPRVDQGAGPAGWATVRLLENTAADRAFGRERLIVIGIDDSHPVEGTNSSEGAYPMAASEVRHDPFRDAPGLGRIRHRPISAAPGLAAE